ncbi:MAG: SRPBCC family protein [Gemmatimonadota bacterium]
MSGVFRTIQDLGAPPSEVFPFFADAFNLERITPPFLRFRVVTPAPIEMRPGALLDYRLRIHGVPIRWRTEITAWDPPRRFVDEQLHGPYRTWVHEHVFEPLDGGGRTRVSDTVRYAAIGGRVIERLFVDRDVERIFAYRRTMLTAEFGDAGVDRGGSMQDFGSHEHR